MDDTTNGFATIVNSFSSNEIVVWLNPYWGAIEYEGKSFEQMKVYLSNKSRVSAIVKIPDLKEETYGRDLSDMLQERLTFIEAREKPA